MKYICEGVYEIHPAEIIVLPLVPLPANTEPPIVIEFLSMAEFERLRANNGPG